VKTKALVATSGIETLYQLKVYTGCSLFIFWNTLSLDITWYPIIGGQLNPTSVFLNY